MSAATDTDRLRWVIWLLSAAILAPTVGLLWLINRGMESERIAVRQRLTESYKRLGDAAAADVADAWDAVLIPPPVEAGAPGALVHAWIDPARQPQPPDSVVLLNPEGEIVHPSHPPESDWVGLSTDDPIFHRAWRAEFAENDPAAAAALYLRIGDDQHEPGPRLAGRAAAVRCLDKAGRPTEAAALAAETLRKPVPPGAGSAYLGLRLRLQLHHTELRCRIDPSNAESIVRALLTVLTAPDSPTAPAADRILALRRALARYHELDGVTPDPALTSRAERRLASETIAAGLLSGAGTPSRLVRHPSRVLFPLGQGKSDYGVMVDLPRGSALLVFTTDTLIAFLHRTASAQLPPELHVRIASPEGSDAAEPNAPRLVDAGLGPAFPGWRLHGYLEGDHALDAAAQQQIALYAWIGILAICLLVAAGAASIQLLSREIRFHRLKNDFVATVTHELKTPLASSRVLVDTLLENGAHDAQQRTEYLEMIARENARLTGLIDRFLTFSRMERGKHSVALEACDPADLVTRAVEAVQMHCLDGARIEVDLEPDLPPLEADPDAVVTVLVNLLDNAVKYTGEHKHIGIRAWQQDETIRFAVHDNGVGIPRRARKRVFTKFYQVDQSLSRSVGGCGLGLSIVDYLVRQHQGYITVDSKPGSGSTFTVTLPLAS